MGVAVPFYAKSLNVGNFYQVLSGDGPPTGAVVDALPIHALYIDTTNKKKYSKIAEGAGSEKWDQHVTLKDVSASMAGPNWRDPVQVVDQTAYADLAAVVTTLNVNNRLDGGGDVDLAPSQWVLLTGVAGQNQNRYQVTGTEAIKASRTYNSVTYTARVAGVAGNDLGYQYFDDQPLSWTNWDEATSTIMVGVSESPTRSAIADAVNALNAPITASSSSGSVHPLEFLPLHRGHRAGQHPCLRRQAHPGFRSSPVQFHQRGGQR